MWTALRSLASRLRFVLRRQRNSEDVSQELATHLELLTARYVDAGMTPDEARQAATH